METQRSIWQRSPGTLPGGGDTGLISLNKWTCLEQRGIFWEEVKAWWVGNDRATLRSWGLPWSSSYEHLTTRGRSLTPRGFLWAQAWWKLRVSQNPLCPASAPLSKKFLGWAVGTPSHSGGWHPRRKEAGEEADKRDSFCLDTNILVISTDGMRNTKKSTWQFRKNLAKCYIFLTYLCRVLDQAPKSLQSRLGMGDCLIRVVFYFKNTPFPVHKSILVNFFPPTKIRHRICLWRCVSLFGRQAV